MPNFSEVLREINLQKKGIDIVRGNYLKKLHEYTKRNIIVYHSGWLQKRGIEGTEITDDDMNGFMMAIHGMDCSKGLDIILHTPGGEIAATEAIIKYLYEKFGDDIRVIVPQLAMSAGTMIACSAKEIMMGKQSNLGPVDPHLKGMPAYGVIHEFQKAHEEIKEDASKLAVWQFILQKYHPTFLSACQNAIDLANDLVKNNLEKVMFKDDKSACEKADEVVKYLTNYIDRKTHSRHINIEECKKIGLKIVALENDQKFQDLVLTIHHCYVFVVANTLTYKIIENHKGEAAYVRTQLSSNTLVPTGNIVPHFDSGKL